jgi:hypothetical protein
VIPTTGGRDCLVRVNGAALRASLGRGVEVSAGDGVWLAVDPARAMVFRRVAT